MLGNSENILSVHFLMRSGNSSVGLSAYLHFVDSVCRFMEIGPEMSMEFYRQFCSWENGKTGLQVRAYGAKRTSRAMKGLNPVCALEPSSGNYMQNHLPNLPTPPKIVIH